jgi:TIR domain
MNSPNVFISYSHDGAAHNEWVRRLAERLVANGIDTTLDQWTLVPGADVVAFMDRGVASADRVLMVCSRTYVEKANKGIGGVGYERLIVSREIFDQVDTTKFVPIIRNNATSAKTPTFIGARLYIDFADDAKFGEAFEELLRAIYNMPAYSKPSLGASPFASIESSGAGHAPSVEPAEASPKGDWMAARSQAANQGLANLGYSGGLEVRFSLTGTDRWSTIDLDAAVRQAEIRTFGWPIGIVLESRQEWQPKPRRDGIYTEVSVADKGFSQTKSYDYWALRHDGTFYLLQSFFEDERLPNSIFFNTRIVRVAEALLFGGRLYTALGLNSERQVISHIKHHGLMGRVLRSSNPSRATFMEKIATDSSVEHALHMRLAQMMGDVTEPVMDVCAPLFALFGLQRFERPVYADIVTKFASGHVT